MGPYTWEETWEKVGVSWSDQESVKYSIKKTYRLVKFSIKTYNELSQKTRFQSVPTTALCLYNIQRENLDFKKSPCITSVQYIKKMYRYNFCAVHQELNQVNILRSTWYRYTFEKTSIVGIVTYMNFCLNVWTFWYDVSF